MGAPHVLVIGGTKGAGRVLVRRFAEKQFAVSVIGRTESDESRRLENVHFCPADLSDNQSAADVVSSSIAQRGKLSHLVFFQRYRGSEDRWAGELQVSLTATKTIIESSAEHFDPVSAAGIVLVASAGARFILADQPVGYHAAKAAMCQMARFYALQLGPKGIRVNSVSPDMYVKEESRKAYEQNRELCALYNQITPLGRMCTAEDVVDAIEFLCSPQASFITGQDIVVDGGISLITHAGLARRLSGLSMGGR